MWPNREYWWSTKQPQVTDLCWQFGFQWHRRGIELVFKSLDCFTKRLFHTATIFCCYICICCLKLHQADYKVEEVFLFFCFLPRFGGGALSSNIFTICAVYWSLGHGGYFGVSNVVLVCGFPSQRASNTFPIPKVVSIVEKWDLQFAKIWKFSICLSNVRWW